MINEEWIKSLSQEKTLWQAYVSSRKIPSTPFNKIVRNKIFPILFFVITFTSFNIKADSIKSGIEALSSTLITIAATILGFLVAGLAVFTTLSDKAVLIEMAKTPQRGTNISTFKYLYFNLISIFVVYIFIICVSVFIYTSCKISIEIRSFTVSDVIFNSSVLINSTAISALSVLFCEAILCLKSFIWNLYTNFISILLVSHIIDGPTSSNGT